MQVATRSVTTETKITRTHYITMSDDPLEGVKVPSKVRVVSSIPDKALTKILTKVHPVVLVANWDHKVDRVFVKTRLNEIHRSWFYPTDKGGLSVFVCEKDTHTIPIKLTVKYGMRLYKDLVANEFTLEVCAVKDTNCFA